MVSQLAPSVRAARIRSLVTAPPASAVVALLPDGCEQAAAKAASARQKSRFIPGLLTNPVLDAYIEPEVIVVTDPIGDAQVINEAVQCGIPVLALCDTNNMTKFVDFVIPTNNKGRKALSMIYFLLTREMLRLRGISTALTSEDFETEF